MILDEHFNFAAAESCVGAAGKALIGEAKSLDGSETRLGSSHKLMLGISVTEEFAGTGPVGFELATAPTATIPTDGSARAMMQLGQFRIEDLELGKHYGIPLPSGSYDEAAFIGILIDRSGAISSGAINAFFALDLQDWEALPEGNN